MLTLAVTPAYGAPLSWMQRSAGVSLVLLLHGVLAAALVWLGNDRPQLEMAPIAVSLISAPAPLPLAPAPAAEAEPAAAAAPVRRSEQLPAPVISHSNPLAAAEAPVVTAAPVAVEPTPVQERAIQEEAAAPAMAAPAIASAAPAAEARHEVELEETPARFDAAYLNNPQPVYPAMSRRLKETGEVLLRVRVEASGRPGAVEIFRSSGYERLDQAAREAVLKWVFIPARRGEQAVAAWVRVPVNFYR